MTKFLFLPLLLLVSCTPVEEKAEDGSGKRRWSDPMSTQEDIERLIDICNSLGVKESKLSIFIESEKKFTFSYAKKKCDDSKLPEMKLVPTIIKETENGYIFSSTNGAEFGFPKVETETVGAMKNLCKNFGTLSSPLRPSENSKIGIWWTTFTGSECQAGFGNLCVKIETGTTNDGETYTMHSTEYIKFKTMDENEGFFIERKLVSTAGCKNGKNLEMRAVLK